MGAEGEADPKGGHGGTVEGGIAQQAVETFGARLLLLVEGQGAGEGGQGQAAVAAAGAAPKLEHGDRQQGQAEGEPASEFGGRGGQQVQHALDEGRLLGFKSPAGPASAPVRQWRRLPATMLSLVAMFDPVSYHLYEW